MTARQRASLLAADAYPEWRRRVRRSTHSVTIFSPYLDSLVLSLLAEVQVPITAVRVITDLSPKSGALDYMGQLRAIKKLVALGVAVASLPRLHAKVLLVDDSVVSVGSQNFTSYGRGSRECSAMFPDFVDEQGFLDTMARWADEAQPVAPALIDELLDAVEAEAEAHARTGAALSDAFKGVLSGHESYGQAMELQRLRRLEDASQTQFAQGAARAELRFIPSESLAGGYWSLIADPGFDLTAWRKWDRNQARDKRLSRLTMCPVMLAHNNQMVFARIARTRISYVRYSVAWSERYRIGRGSVQVATTFPTSQTKVRNIVFEIRPVYSPGVACRVEAFFDGEELLVRGVTRSPGVAASTALDDFVLKCDKHFSNDAALRIFFGKFVRNFEFERLGIDNPNAGDFFTRGRTRLSLIEFADTPVLVSSRMA